MKQMQSFSQNLSPIHSLHTNSPHLNCTFMILQFYPKVSNIHVHVINMTSYFITMKKKNFHLREKNIKELGKTCHFLTVN